MLQGGVTFECREAGWEASATMIFWGWRLGRQADLLLPQQPGSPAAATLTLSLLHGCSSHPEIHWSLWDCFAASLALEVVSMEDVSPAWYLDSD